MTTSPNEKEKKGVCVGASPKKDVEMRSSDGRGKKIANSAPSTGLVRICSMGIWSSIFFLLFRLALFGPISGWRRDPLGDGGEAGFVTGSKKKEEPMKGEIGVTMPFFPPHV